MDRHDQMAETYEEVKNLIWKVCHEFQRRHGGDIDELFAQSNLTFVHAYNQFDPSKGVKFYNYLATCVYRRLTEHFQSYKYRGKRHPSRVVSMNVESDTGSLASIIPDALGDITNVWLGLSSDAWKVIHLALTASDDLHQIAMFRNKKKLRKFIDKYLQSCGWDDERITESISEIREALAA